MMSRMLKAITRDRDRRDSPRPAMHRHASLRRTTSLPESVGVPVPDSDSGDSDDGLIHVETEEGARLGELIRQHTPIDAAELQVFPPSLCFCL